MCGKERYKEILVTAETMFTVEETVNKQNCRVYARSSKEARELVPRIERGHYPASVMVWLGGVTSLRFCEYNKCSGTPKPNMFQNRPWIF